MDLPKLSTGCKPHQFTLGEQSNEYYMMGSEAGAYMGLLRGAIYKKFPKLWRRVATAEERKHIYTAIADPNVKVATNVTLVKSADIANIVMGNDKEYRETFTSLIEKMEAKQLRDSQLNGKLNSSCQWSSIIDVDVDENVPLMFNDFNMFSLPLCDLTMAKNLPLSLKKSKCSSIYLDWKYSKNLSRALETIKDELIPIRLYISIEPYLLNDVFFWNKSSSSVEPFLDYYTFAEVTCDDCDLPLDIFGPEIVKSMKQQVERYVDDSRLVEIFKKSKKSISNPLATINLDITMGATRFQDTFQWDIANSCDPDLCIKFGQTTVKDLNLSPEFIVPICVCTFGQLLWHRHLQYVKSMTNLPKPTHRLYNPNTTIDYSFNVSSQSINVENLPINQSTVDPSDVIETGPDVFIPKIIQLDAVSLETLKNDIDKQMRRIESCVRSSSSQTYVL